MGGELERADPDQHGFQALVEPYPVHEHVIEALPRFEDALWYLEEADTPEEILVNVPAVLWTAVGLLGADGTDPRIDAECRAWQAVHSEGADRAAFHEARDQVVRWGWHLDGLARGWLADAMDVNTQLAHAYAGLGELSAGAAAARLSIHPA